MRVLQGYSGRHEKPASAAVAAVRPNHLQNAPSTLQPDYTGLTPQQKSKNNKTSAGAPHALMIDRMATPLGTNLGTFPVGTSLPAGRRRRRRRAVQKRIRRPREGSSTSPTTTPITAVSIGA